MKLYYLIIMIAFILTLTVSCAAPTPAPRLTPVPIPTPAAFSLSDLTIQPAEVQPSEVVTVTVDITNTGDTDGRYTATLMINGVMEADKSVTVAAGGTKAVTFSVTREDAASYSVVVDSLSGSFTVVTPTPTLTPIPTPTPQAPITILSDTTLTTDLTLDGSGIIIGTDNITLDLGGHTITGPGKGPWIWPYPALSSIGIELTDRKGITIRNGYVTGFATGLLLRNSDGIVIQNITTSLNHYGMYLGGSDNNTVTDSDITSNVYGLTLMDSKENRITKNHMFNNHYNSPGGYGICLIASSKNIVTENKIDSNETQGIWLIESWDNLVAENTIDSNQAQGIWLAETWDNLIYHNNVMGNQPNAVDEAGSNLWYDPATKEGNYWSDYAGDDLDGDGIGDTPYQFFDQAQDPFPFINMDDW